MRSGSCLFFFYRFRYHRDLHVLTHPSPTRRSSDLATIFGTVPRDGETLVTGNAPPRLGSGHPSFCPYRNYRSNDGVAFFLACFTEKFWRSEGHTSELQSIMRISYAVLCLQQKN